MIFEEIFNDVFMNFEDRDLYLVFVLLLYKKSILEVQTHINPFI